MRIVTHRCDFCGAKRPEKLMAKLTIPLTEEERKIRQRALSSEEREIERVRSHPLHLSFALFGTGLENPEPSTTTMDMCKECVTGLLACRFREIRKALAATED